MAQSALISLGISRNNIFAPSDSVRCPNKFGDSIPTGPAGTLLRRTEAEEVDLLVRKEWFAVEAKKVDDREPRLAEYHYATAKRISFERAGRIGETIAKPLASIAGYGGFVPRKEACGIIGCSFSKGNEQAHDKFVQEAQIARSIAKNIKLPESDLSTPNSY